MSFNPMFESLENRRLLSADASVLDTAADLSAVDSTGDTSVLDVAADPVTLAQPLAALTQVAPAAVTVGSWNLIGTYNGTYADVKNAIGADYHVEFTAQRHGFLHATIRGNGDVFAATGTIDSGGKVNLVYRLSSHRYYLYGQIGKAGTRLSGFFSIRNGGVVTAWGSFITHKQRS